MFEWLEEKLRESRAAVRAQGRRLLADLSAPARENAIKAAEERLGIPLSNDHREFLRLHDGAYLAISPGELAHYIKILSVQDLLSETERLRRTIPRADLEGSAEGALLLIALADYQGCGDMCLLNSSIRNTSGDYAVIDAFNETPDKWLSAPPIAGSFSEWLANILDSVSRDRRCLEFWMPHNLGDAFLINS